MENNSNNKWKIIINSIDSTMNEMLHNLHAEFILVAIKKKNQLARSFEIFVISNVYAFHIIVFNEFGF